jgi:hypothetical protein
LTGKDDAAGINSLFAFPTFLLSFQIVSNPVKMRSLIAALSLTFSYFVTVSKTVQVSNVEYVTRTVTVDQDIIDLVGLVVTFDQDVSVPIVPFLPGMDVSLKSYSAYI